MGNYTDPFAGSKQVDSNHRYKHPCMPATEGATSEQLAAINTTINQMRIEINNIAASSGGIYWESVEWENIPTDSEDHGGGTTAPDPEDEYILQ